jgi:hypothetical protein
MAALNPAPSDQKFSKDVSCSTKHGKDEKVRADKDMEYILCPIESGGFLFGHAEVIHFHREIGFMPPPSSSCTTNVFG